MPPGSFKSELRCVTGRLNCNAGAILYAFARKMTNAAPVDMSDTMESVMEQFLPQLRVELDIDIALERA